MIKARASARPHRRSDRQRQVGAGARARASAATESIVNADSAQLYRDLPILSRRADRRRTWPRRASPLRRPRRRRALLGGRLGGAGARAEIADVHARGQLPILVGGTGLYLRTLLDGIAPVPPIDPEVRADGARARASRRTMPRLQRLDPDAAARLNPGDTTRVARALEVVRSTGRTAGATGSSSASGGIGDAVDASPADPAARRATGSTRAATSASPRWSSKARSTRSRPCSRASSIPSLPVMRAIGVREIAALLRGELTAMQAIAAGQQATRHYAKRQYTWFAQPAAGRLAALHRAARRARRIDARAGAARRGQLAQTPWNCSATPTSTPPRSPASASRSSAIGNQGRAQALNLTRQRHRRRRRPARRIRRAPPRSQRAGLARAAASKTPSPAPTSSCCSPPTKRWPRSTRTIEPHLRHGAALGFSHGLAIHFGLIAPRADLDVFLVAPKGPGTALRSLYQAGRRDGRAVGGRAGRQRHGARRSPSPMAARSAAAAPA